MNALTYTTGYNSLAGWQKWDGYHQGKWYSKAETFNDGAQWNSPYTKSQIYAVQPIRFDSQWRKVNCKHRDMPLRLESIRTRGNNKFESLAY